MKKILFFILFLYSISCFAQASYNVSGSAYLDDVLPSTTDHSGIEVKFIDLIQQDTVATAVTDSLGDYSIGVPPGFYLVRWEKYGYIPFEVGNYALSSDTTLQNVTLLPGFIQDVCGNVNGVWSSGSVYHVLCNITVPQGDTLTIENGVTVKFMPGTGLVCNGTLNVLGNDSSKVLFTSKAPTPLPGDWDNVELYGFLNNINHLIYEYATDGFTGSNAIGSSFNNVYMVGNLSLTANGIYLNNSASMTFTNNTIAVAGDYGIFCSNSSSSTIQNNSIDGSYSEAAIRMDNCAFCTFDGNIITNHPERGIWANDGFTNTITNNIMDVSQKGMEVVNGSYLTINNNVINDFQDIGIDFHSSENSTVNNNRIISVISQNWKKAIYNGDSQQNAVINYNYILVGSDTTNVSWSDENYFGIEAHDSEIKGDTIIINTMCNGYGISAGRSTIEDNYIKVFQRYDCNVATGIYNWSDNVNRGLVKNNTIEANGYSRGIAASYSDILDNTISHNSTNAYTYCCYFQENYMYGIGWGDENYIKGNTLSNLENGIYANGNDRNIIDSNFIQVSRRGVFAPNSDSLIVINNTIQTNSNEIIWTSDGASTIKYNLLRTSSGRGIHCENQAGIEFSNNTIISSSSGDYGIHISNLSAPIVRNNIIQGFQNGIYADNTLVNYSLSYNDLWQITGNMFDGSAMPPLIGQPISLNANGDVSDIYGNLNLDPDFVFAWGGNYNLNVTSPCINAGDPSSPYDPDLTIADIGP